MSITFKKTALQRLPSENLRELYIKVFDVLPSVGFNNDDNKYDKALIDALVSGEKVSDEIYFGEEVPDDADE